MSQITQLNDLKVVADSDFTATFANSLDQVFIWATNDITSTLNHRNIDILSMLRNKLCEQAKDTFPQIASKTPINRRVKHLVIKDIITLGDCLAKGNSTNDLEKVVFSQATNPADSHVAYELSIIVNMLDTLQSSVTSLSMENKQLTAKLESSLERKCSCKCQCNTPPVNTQSAENVATPPGGLGQSVPSTSEEVPQASSSAPNSQVTVSSPAATKPLSSAASQKPTRNAQAQNVAPKGPSKKEVYFGNVNINNSAADIAFHLESKGIDLPASDVRLLKQRQDAASYCLKVQEKDFQKAADSTQSIWPAGIKVRPFLEQAPKGLQSSKARNTHHNDRFSGRQRQSSRQPFRHAWRSRSPPAHDRRLPSHPNQRQYVEYEPQYRFASDNRFSPLSYEDEYECEYDHAWPSLWHSARSARVGQYYDL